MLESYLQNENERAMDSIRNYKKNAKALRKN
jgi:hypothetical protein